MLCSTLVNRAHYATIEWLPPTYADVRQSRHGAF